MKSCRAAAIFDDNPSYICYNISWKPPNPWKLGEGGDYMYHFIFADNLARLCKEQGCSVNALARAIGKSPRQVNRYRNGQCENISLKTLAKIAAVLDVSITDLLSV